MQKHEIKEYYRQISAIDIGEVARELLGSRITENGDSVIHIDCPRHHSTSGKSLHVEIDKQLWRCWGCGISGDVLQLVEFVRHGVVTTGLAGTMTDTHRDARNWLADKIGLPKLSHMGLSDEDIKRIEQQEVNLQSARSVLTAAADWYHARLMENSEMKAWLKKQYDFNDELLISHRIGFADINGLRNHLYDMNFTTEELLASGLFRPNDINDETKVLPVFNQRIMFPYLSQGRVTYFIGRKCPLTPDDKWEGSKYKKLPTYDPEKRPWIAAGIENNQLFNEDCLQKRINQVIITEGITDCITLMNHGFISVSPVTTNIRQEDWNRLIPRLKNVKEVVICQDNEISKAGWQGALKTATILEKAGISCRIAVLPLDDKQIEARKNLHDKYGISESVGMQSVQSKLTNFSDSEKTEAKYLLDIAKVDVCSYFVDGHSKDDFISVIHDAKSSVEYAINLLNDSSTSTNRLSQVDDLLIQISYQPELEQDRLLRLLQSKLGNDYRLPALRSRMKSCKQSIIIENQKKIDSQTEDDGRAIFVIGRNRYQLIDNGIVREIIRDTPNGPLISAAEQITNFHMKINKILLRDDGIIHEDGTTTAETSVQGEIIGSDWHKTFHMEGSKWGSNAELARKITATVLHKASFSTHDIDDIRQVASHLSKDATQHVVYVSFGQHINDGFVAPTVTIKDGEMVSTKDRGAFFDIPLDHGKARSLDLLPGTVDEVKSLIDHLLKDYLNLQALHITLPILAHAFIGPILFSHNFTEMYTPFILYLTGSSGKGKTETGRLGQCLWGDFTTKEKLGGWGSTPEANRKEAARCHGGMWMMDDFKKDKIGRGQWHAALRIVTDYADLQSRKKATPGSGMDISSAPIRAMLLITGEDLPANESSALARSLMVNYTGNTYTTEKIYRRCIANHHNYSKVTAAFIAWWQKQDPDYWHKRLRDTVDNIMAFIENDEIMVANSRRMASNAALSLIGLEAFLDFAVSIGCNPQEMSGMDLIIEHTAILKDILRNMSVSVSRARPGESFMIILVQLLQAGRVRIKDRYVENNNEYGVPIIGYYSPDRTMVYLLPDLAMAAVRDAYKRGSDETLNFSTNAIGKQLTEDGILHPEDIKENKQLHRVRIPGASRGQTNPNAWRIYTRDLDALVNKNFE